jgi:hypothetical protein
LPLLVHCISRCNSCSPTIKPMTPVLLRLLVNGDQGQDSRTTLFLLNTGQRSSIAWWRTTNHFVKWQMSMVSRMKRSVASYFVSRSSVGAAPDDGGEFGHLSQRLDRALDFAYPCLIPEHSMLPISGSEDPYGLSDRLVPAHVLPHHFSGTALVLWLAHSPAFPFQNKSGAHYGASSAQATHPRRLPCLSSRHHSLEGAGPDPSPVRPWREVKSRRGARHPREHRGLRLSQPAMRILRDH